MAGRYVCGSFYVVILLLLVAGCLEALLRDPTVAFPPDSEFILSSGESVPMPFQVWDSWHGMSIGTVSAREATPFLREINLHPLTPHSEERCLATIGAVEYQSSSVGEYYEYYVMLLASEEEIKSPVITYMAVVLGTNRYVKPLLDLLLIPPVRAVVYRMVVDSPKSMLAGREIWGYPKELTAFRVEDSDNRRVVKVGCESERGEFVSAIDTVFITKSSVFNPLLPVALDGVTATGAALKHTSGRTAAVSRGALFAFYSEEDIEKIVSSVDVFSTEQWSDSKCARVVEKLAEDVKALEFTPLLSTYYDEIKCVLFSPY